MKSFASVQYDTKQIALYFADNASKDDTIGILKELQDTYRDVFRTFEIIETGDNKGFGGGSNIAARAGDGDFVFFCNVDTEIEPNAFAELDIAIAAADGFDAFELRQFPYEHPKYYDPITLEVPYASGACFLMRRPLFEKTGGFDETIFMYAEDVELSWRLRVLGHKIRYVPSAILYHYAYESANEVKPMQSAGSVVGSWVLRAKYGSKAEFAEWKMSYERVVNFFAENPTIQTAYEEMMKNARKHLRAYRSFYRTHVEHSGFKPIFAGFDYCFARSGAFYENVLPKQKPFFSIVVRTYQRPEILAYTLYSLTHQTYKHFEVIVCEDGPCPISEETVNKFADKLQIRYHSMNQSAGRCDTANKGILLARGEYINLLDDDDYFYPEHLEVLAAQIEKAPEARMFVFGSLSVDMDSTLEKTVHFSPQIMRNISREKLTLLEMYCDNCMPIQAVAFHRSLPEEAGLFDNLFIDAYEDWDLWVRYMQQAKCRVTEKATSCYRVPESNLVKLRRMTKMNNNLALIRDRFSQYQIEVNATALFDINYSLPRIQERITSGLTELEMHRVYDQILQSRTWRFTKVPRWVGTSAAALFIKIAHILRRLNDRLVGPQKVEDPDTAHSTQFHLFIVKTRNSAAWRALTRAADRRK